MATIYKPFLNNDVTSTRTLLHESIPITGSIVSGTYADGNIKNYSHNMFQSVYDYPYLSSSANHIFDITCGFASTSALSGSTNVVDQDKKIEVYNQMAQVLAGYDHTGSIRKFDLDGNYAAGGDKIDSAFFLNFARLTTKDEIKKGSFQLTLGSALYASPFTGSIDVYDANAASSYKVNSPAGEYGLLYTSSVGEGSVVGHLYYQAGVAVLTSSVFLSSTGVLQAQYSSSAGVASSSAPQAIVSSSISANATAFRNRIANITFNNTTETESA